MRDAETMYDCRLESKFKVLEMIIGGVITEIYKRILDGERDTHHRQDKQGRVGDQLSAE